MKVFRVVTEIDGEVTKSPGTTSTEVRQIDRRFAASKIERVMRLLPAYMTPDEVLMAIIEEHPSIIILEVTEDNNAD